MEQLVLVLWRSCIYILYMYFVVTLCSITVPVIDDSDEFYSNGLVIIFWDLPQNSSSIWTAFVMIKKQQVNNTCSVQVVDKFSSDWTFFLITTDHSDVYT